MARMTEKHVRFWYGARVGIVKLLTKAAGDQRHMDQQKPIFSSRDDVQGGFGQLHGKCKDVLLPRSKRYHGPVVARGICAIVQQRRATLCHATCDMRHAGRKMDLGER